jgi:hypothetical protein
MQGKHLFEYAVIRLVPHVEREEFLNVGVIMFCKEKKFLGTKFELHEDRLRMLCNHLSLDEIKLYILSFERICAGGDNAGPIGKLSAVERFRWLTAARSTVVQTSRVHPGFCDEAQPMLDHLFDQLVSFS